MTRLYFHSGCRRLAAIHPQSLIDEGKPTEVNGVAPIFLTASNFERSS